MAVTTHRRLAQSASLLLAALVAATTLACAAGAQTWGWTEQAPMARSRSGAVYDSLHDRMVIISSFDDVVTATLDAPTTFARIRPLWTPTSGMLSEQATTRSAIYDSRRDRILVTSSAYDPVIGESYLALWALKLDPTPVWTNLSASYHSWPSYSNFSLVLDTNRDRLVIFGGVESFSFHDESVSSLGIFDLATNSGWSTLTSVNPPAEGPGDRYGHGAIYDPDGDRMVIFHGARLDAFTIYPLDDAWSLSFGDSVRWSPITTSGSLPAARFVVNSMWDGAPQRALMYGGLAQIAPGVTTPKGDLWALQLDSPNAATWALVNAASPENQRTSPSTMFDPTRRRVALHGGHARRDYGPELQYCDSWQIEVDGPSAWTPLGSVTESPVLTNMMSSFARPGTDDVCFVLGNGSSVDRGFAWIYDAAHYTWRHIPRVPDANYSYASATYDSRRDRILGITSEHTLPNLRLITLGVSAPAGWVSLPQVGRPTTYGGQFGILYDEVLDQFVVLGGQANFANGFGPPSDKVWLISMSTGTPTWSQAPIPAPLPDPNSYFTMACLDAANRRVIVMDPSTIPMTQWTLNLDPPMQWSAHTTSGLGPRSLTSVTFDPDRSQVILLSQESTPGSSALQSVAWCIPMDGPWSWNRLAAPSPAPARRYASIVVDRNRSRLLMVGGPGDGSSADSEVWALPLDDTTPTELSISRVEISADHVELHWHSPAPVRDAVVHRRTSGSPTKALGRVSSDWAGDLDFVDREVVPGAEYFYRLTTGVDSVGFVTPETRVVIPGGEPAFLSIDGSRPSPARGSIVLAVRLPDQEPARIELLDVTGRRVAARSIVAQGAGEQLINLGRTTAFHSGVYFARLHHRGRMVTRRVVVAD